MLTLVACSLTSACEDLSGLDTGVPADGGPDSSSAADARGETGAPASGETGAAGGDSGMDSGTEAGKEAGADAGGASLIQQTSATASQVMSTMLQFSAVPTSGDALILATNSTHSTPISVTGGGVDWSMVASSGVHEATSLWAGFAVSSGSMAIVVTWSDVESGVAVCATEWSGLAGILQQATQDGNAQAIITAAATTTVSDALILAAIGMHDHGATLVGNSFTPFPTVALASSDLQLMGAYDRVSVAGSYSASWTQADLEGWDALIAVFSVTP